MAFLYPSFLWALSAISIPIELKGAENSIYFIKVYNSLTKKCLQSYKIVKNDINNKCLKLVCHNVNFDLRVIKSELLRADIEINDLAGDDNHYAAKIKSSKFKGKTRVQQHQMVYASLKGKMGNELHALALTTEEK